MPSTKVATGLLVGAATTLIVWAAGEFAHISIPPDVASAAVTLAAGLAAYWVPERNPAPSAVRTVLDAHL